MVKWKELTEEHVARLKKKMKEKLDEMTGEDLFAFLCDGCWEAYKDQAEAQVREWRTSHEVLKEGIRFCFKDIEDKKGLCTVIKEWREKAEKLPIYEKQFKNMTEHAIELETRLSAVKTYLKDTSLNEFGLFYQHLSIGTYKWFKGLRAAAEG